MTHPEQAPPHPPLRVAMHCRLDRQPPAGYCLLLAVCWLTVLTACGDSRRGAIEGTVTLDGRPLEKGYISFRPQLGTPGPAAGAEILDGKFAIPAEGGTFGGTFRVEITASRKTGQKVMDRFSGQPVDAYAQFIPAKYNSQTELQAEVNPDAPNRFEFAITSD